MDSSMPVYKFKNRPYDQYFHDIIDMTSDVLSDRKLDFSIYYDIGFLTKKLCYRINNDPAPLIVIVTVDNLNPKDLMIQSLKSLPKDKIYIITTSVKNAEKNFTLPGQNYYFVHQGGDFLFQQNEYPSLLPQREKNLDSVYHGISLNRAPRLHRVLAACALLGNDLGLSGGPLCLSMGPQYQTSYEKFYHAQLTFSDQQQIVVDRGLALLKDSKHSRQSDDNFYDIVGTNNNVENFDRFLRKFYQHSLVEIVNETTFLDPGIFVTEKFLNSVYGYNLPIILSNAGSVDYLRSAGFDMFDDVIDHSYDLVENPVDRVFALIEQNKNLLKDKNFAYRAWHKLLPRLDNNYRFAKENMYQHFKYQYVDSLKSLLDGGGRWI